jgi:hypothetical protein
MQRLVYIGVIMNMLNYFQKFNIGDEVSISGDPYKKVGKVIEVCSMNKYGEFEYCVDFGDSERHYYESDLICCKPTKSTKCECGAIKVHGDSASKYHHALWCVMGI